MTYIIFTHCFFLLAVTAQLYKRELPIETLDQQGHRPAVNDNIECDSKVR